MFVKEMSEARQTASLDWQKYLGQNFIDYQNTVTVLKHFLFRFLQYWLYTDKKKLSQMRERVQKGGIFSKEKWNLEHWQL